MANPARELITVLEALQTSSPKKYRWDEAGDKPVAVSQLKFATELLEHIDRLLGDIGNDPDKSVSWRAKNFRSGYLSFWWRDVLEYAADLSRGSRNPRSQHDYKSLIECAEFFDEHPQYEPRALEKLREILREARTTLESDDSLSSELRLFIHRLLSEVEAALDDDAVGCVYDFAVAAERLYMAFKAAEAERTEYTGTWHELWVAFVPGTVGAGLVEGVSLIVQALTT